MSTKGIQFQIADAVLARSVGDSLVLFQPETERLLSLDACGTRIWELLTEGLSTAQVVAQLTEEFAAPDGLIHEQTLEFFSQLESERLIRRQG